MKPYPEPEIREFETDLAWSESMPQWSFYLLVLGRFFPDIGAEWDRITDLLRQKKGGDLTICGEVIQIKARRKFYDDIALEYTHIKPDGSSWDGWIRQPHNISRLLYCFPGSGIAYLHDWLILQTLYFYHEKSRLGGGRFPKFSSQNPEYKTWCVGLPVRYLEEALIDKVDFKNETQP